MSLRQDSGCFDESKEEDGSPNDACTSGTIARDDSTQIYKHEKRYLQQKVEGITESLDSLTTNILVKQNVLAREFEDRIRHVYDDVINDINSIRKCVNSIGDKFDHDTKFKTWTPVMPFRKEVLPSVYEIKKNGNTRLKGSKSVDFVDQKGRESYEPFESDTFSKYQSKTTFCKRRSWLDSSRSSVNSIFSNRKSVPGFGQCFIGDGKTVPYRSYKALPISQRNNRHSWGPSRYGSRSALDDDDDDIDRGCLCGTVTDDWRAKVAPYMWDGCPVPGLDRPDIGKLRERYEQMENMRHDVVKVHNEYRKLHGCPDLTVATDLATDAQQWSDILTMKGYAQYSDVESRGENILVVDIADTLTGRQVVDTWYRESKYYNYKAHRWQRGTSNFTQMIWKSSKFVGVGISKMPYHDTYIIVVQYLPPGNFNTIKQFRRNVPVPISTDSRKVSHSEDELSDSDDVFDTNTTDHFSEIGTKDTANRFSLSNYVLNPDKIGTQSRDVAVMSSCKEDVACQTKDKIYEHQPSGFSTVSNDQLQCETKYDHNDANETSLANKNDSEKETTVASVSEPNVSSLNDLVKDDDFDKVLKIENKSQDDSNE